MSENRPADSTGSNEYRTQMASARWQALLGDLPPDIRRQVPDRLMWAGDLRLAHPEDSIGQLAIRGGVSRDVMAGLLRRLEKYLEWYAPGR